MKEPEISYEYIRGLIEGEGCFSFSPTGREVILSNGKSVKEKSPGFYLVMHERDKCLIETVRDSLNLANKVYRRKNQVYQLGRADSYVLAVRDFESFRSIIIPLFYGKLHGHKGYQFLCWLEEMGEENKSHPARTLYFLYKTGFFDSSIDEFL